MFRTVCMKYSNGDYDLASDYCQLGYVKVHKNLHTFKGEGSIEGWVRRVLITTIINEMRLKKQKKYIDTTTDYDFERTDLADEPEENIEENGAEENADQIPQRQPAHPRIAKEVQVEKIINDIKAPGPLT